MNEDNESQHKARGFNARELFDKIKNDPEFKKEERFLELTEDILSVVGDRLTKLEHEIRETRQKLCVVAQAVLKIPISLLFLQEEKNATNCEQIGKELTQLVADLTPKPKKSATITPEDEPLREYGEDG